MTWVSEAAPAVSPGGSPAGLRVWVTGASRGLGRAIAADLSAAGARLALTSRTDAALAEIHEVCGEDALRVPGSVADEDDLSRMSKLIEREWDGLDAVVHCAGISPAFLRADKLDVRTWREIVDVNLTGTFLVCKAAASLMTGGGSIITTSSVHARSGAARLAAYSATKGAVESLTRALALDWAGRGIRVNCLAPGYFETDMTEDLARNENHRARLLRHIPMGVLGTPSQLVEMVRVLLGPGGSYITGSVLAVDGGWSAY
ncbi:SDR family NAD(P)-dependent oxidoreductase [Amycolatopsis sp.]|uniref:SDR family NAD(P)-dependent oxidoreductase n=1 Tax=Amycolatopsis sp. TaxID=37632 RepID=UPI002B7023FF|nr:SDR family NAD(P)-dependent oxidoreductase [Amycolatopsis sp.]HVV10463.1 SDR family NAD(P)-dependent oxidoreductase [Amycolatopsis sp.]